MKNNFLVLLVGFVLYVLAFQFAGFLLGQYVLHIKGPVFLIVVFEQSVIPFVFGYYVYKRLNVKSNFSPLLVLIMPVCLIIPSTIWDVIQGEDVTIFEHAEVFIMVVLLQLIFVVAGAYLQYFIKNKNT